MKRRRGNILIEALEARRLLTVVFTVTSTADSGVGSLRGAIQQANVTDLPQSATILFDIPGSGVHTIKPLSALPAITVQMNIEGTTDSKGNPLIELDGENAGALAPGLLFTRNTPGNSKPSVVTGLVINRFDGDGVDIAGTAPTNIYGCRIGTDAAGKKARPNGGFGINASVSNNRIGMPGDGAEFQLLVSGNLSGGIGVASNNVIQNCFVGTDVTGKKAIGNTGFGIEAGSFNQIGGRYTGEGNLISGNTKVNASGIILVGHDNEVMGNLIGTNFNNTDQIPNAIGMLLDGAFSNIIGSYNDAPAQNIIAGSQQAGLVLRDGADLNKIYSNLIGPFNDTGVLIVDSSNNSLSLNHITQNRGDGLHIEQENIDTTDNQVTTCVIDQNGGNGVTLIGGARNVISGELSSNSLAGLEINGDASGCSFFNGEIFDNGKLGITIGDNIGTDHPNHGANDSVAGLPDGGINHPVVTSVTVEYFFTTIKGTYVGTPNADYNLTFWRSDSPDPSGFGQGQEMLPNGTQLHTDGNGDATFSYKIDVVLTNTQVATAIAYDSNGNISEFSNAVRAKGASISGHVFKDANGNGKQDSGEKSASKQTIYIDDNNDGLFDGEEQSTKSNSSGNYKLFGVNPGTVHVRLLPADGYVQTFPGSAKPFYKPTVAPFANITGKDFGVQKSTFIPAGALIAANWQTTFTSIQKPAGHKKSVASDLLSG